MMCVIAPFLMEKVPTEVIDIGCTVDLPFRILSHCNQPLIYKHISISESELNITTGRR